MAKKKTHADEADFSPETLLKLGLPGAMCEIRGLKPAVVLACWAAAALLYFSIALALSLTAQSSLSYAWQMVRVLAKVR
ncbi:hypothetical protein [Phenylobacterium sp.]|uniref:hypothetical protein n=1 Tax=Phenylobacterium sp. TaxID=1871053 RepID=UPI002DF43333|nr:hypothetical protein [Phenylobacterium sp.]